jgi:ERCC4-related helicase
VTLNVESEDDFKKLSELIRNPTGAPIAAEGASMEADNKPTERGMRLLMMPTSPLMMQHIRITKQTLHSD